MRSVALVAWIMGIVASGAAAASLWAGASRAGSLLRAGCQLPGNQRAGYRWLASAAGLWCVGTIAQQAFSGLLGTVAPPLQFADLFLLFALIPGAAGIILLAGPVSDKGGNPAPDGPPAAWKARAPQAWPLRTYLPHLRWRHLGDSYVMAASLFLIGWLIWFGPGYHRSGEGAATFVLDLARPFAGLLVVSALLPVAAQAGRRMAQPYASLLLVVVGDALGASARLGGASQPNATEQFVKLVGYCLLAAVPWVMSGGLRSARQREGGDSAPASPAEVAPGDRDGAPEAASASADGAAPGGAAMDGAAMDGAAGGLAAGSVAASSVAASSVAASSAASSVAASSVAADGMADRVAAGGAAADGAAIDGAADGVAADGVAAGGAADGVVAAADGEAADGEAADGEAADGEAGDGEAADGEAADGEAGDGQAADVEAGDGGGGQDAPGVARLPGLPGIEAAPVVAGFAAAAAAAVIAIREVAGFTSMDPAVVLAASTALLAVVARLIGLVRQNGLALGAAEASGGQFRELADRTSDVVLVCDQDGTIRYVSPSAELYGYQPEDLAGSQLAELVHPEDLAAGSRAVHEILAGEPLVRLACRVRGSDGTWRHVEATLSPYRRIGAADKLLLTARDVSDQVALRQQLTHLTFHDGLTGLPNRAYFTERVRDLLGRGKGQVAALFMDLDRFTAVNDSIGHAAGDLLLTQAARRLRTAVAAHDTVSRWGGDEFAILAETSAGPKEVVELAERVVQCVAANPFRVAGREMTLTASVGVAVADRSSGAVAEDVMRNADVAMSRAKGSGGGRFEIFAAHMHADVVRRLEISSDLQRAVADERLMVEYQPIVELPTSRVTGVEALVRWCRGGEQVPPAEFLEAAEESGLIVPLGDWVLREACRQAAEWRRSSWDVGVSVNFSPRQIGAPWVIDSVASALKSSGLPASALTLEVTERALVGHAGEAVQRLAELRHLGVRLAIDDFGTGYASLAYLRQLPVDIIKIDPSFVAGLGTDDTLTLLTRTIVRLGHDLGMVVVAEGIERPQQLDMLREMGCARGQGYLVARPMPAQQVESLLDGGAHRSNGYSPAKAS